MTQQQIDQHQKFNAAKKIALAIDKGCMRRARYNDMATNYIGLCDNNGRMWVIGDTETDILNPDAIINGKPAREIFGDFTHLIK